MRNDGMMLFVTRFALGLALTMLTASGALAQAEKSLDKCQKAAAKQSAAFVAGRTKALQKCLQKISAEIIKSDAANTAGAAKACAASLRKLVNQDAPGKTVAEKAKGKMRKACDPAVVPGLKHTTNQVLSLTPAGVAEGLEAEGIESYCQAFGGDSAFGSVEEWVDCQIAGGTCESNQNIATQYPRAIEWLTDVKPHILALGAVQKYTDAAAAVDQILLALDANSDMTLDINCGPGDGLCGNGTMDAGEECDGVNLDGETCVTQGFPEGGTLACKGNCGFNYQGCTSGSFSKTGQTTVYTAGDDGDIQAGPPFAFTDNGDGTITDDNTGFMWEKFSDDSGINDQDTGYTWSAAFGKIAALNTMPCFAGYCDWRLPNIRELQSILDLGRSSPAIDPVFNNGCTLGCTVLTCSCTQPKPMWSSTTYVASTGQAWFINFQTGRLDPNPKTISQQVRAVRGP